jgi:3-methyladenine DNA glycosylase AlkD
MPDLPQGDMLEEKLLRGFVIAGADLPFEEHLKAVADFVPEIDNWSVCDSFVNSLKFFKKDRELVWEFLQPYFDSDKPYDIRFAVVSALNYFSDDEYAARAFEKFDAITNDDYYVKMAVAWAVSVFFVHSPEKTWQYLKDNRLDDFTFNKSLQKITESYRVTPQDKAKIRAMKRK